MGNQRCIPEACGFPRPYRPRAAYGCLAAPAGVLPGSSQHAAIASVLALYPSTTTEIPFT